MRWQPHPICSRDKMVAHFREAQPDPRFEDTWQTFFPKDLVPGNRPRQPALQDIDKAIAAGPYHGLTTAQAVIEGGSLPLSEVITLVLNSHPDGEVCAAALTGWEQLVKRVGLVEATRVVSGIRSDGPSVSWLLPSVFASYVSVAVAEAVLAVRNQINIRREQE